MSELDQIEQALPADSAGEKALGSNTSGNYNSGDFKNLGTPSSNSYTEDDYSKGENSLSKLTQDELLHHVKALQERYRQQKIYNLQLEKKLDRTLTRGQRLGEETHKQDIQMETMTIMAKYQLVFSQLEAAFLRTIDIGRHRERKSSLQRAFHQMKRNAQTHRRKLHTAKFATIQSLMLACQNMNNNFNKYHKEQRLRRSFLLWHHHTKADNTIKDLKQSFKPKVISIMQDQEKSQKTLQEKRDQLQKLQNQLKDLKAKLQQVLQAQQAVNAQSAAQAASSAGQQGPLKQKIEALKSENARLSRQLQAVKDNLSAYLNEANEFYSAQEQGIPILFARENEEDCSVLVSGTGEP